MPLLDFLLSLGVACGLTYLGKKQNEEAEKRNSCAEGINNACNRFIEEVNTIINNDTIEIKRILRWYGELKTRMLNTSFHDYCKIMKENFTNFDVVLTYQKSKYDALRLYGQEDIDNSVRLIADKTHSQEYRSDNNLKNAFAISLGVFGTVAAISAIANGAASLFSLTSKLSLANLMPISFGVGYSVTGFLNNYKSKQNMENAIEQQKKIEEMEPKIQETINYLQFLINTLTKIKDTSKLIANIYEKEIEMLLNDTKDVNSPFYSSKEHPIDLSKLSRKDQQRIRYLYAYSRIAYTILDIRLFSSDGKFLESSVRKFDDNKKLLADALQTYYG